MKVSYSEYMKSDAWADKRSLVLARSSGKCEKCGFDACDGGQGGAVYGMQSSLGGEW